MATEYSADCLKILERLGAAKNVLISGPPGTGKSRLMGEVARAFETGLVAPKASSAPALDSKARIPIPPPPPQIEPALAKALPAPQKKSRKVYRTVFHQNSKHRDFVTGIIPNTQRKQGDPDFTIIQGKLFEASEHAKQADGAALLIIDEINRGPAVQVFGGSIVAIEADKRLGADGNQTMETQFFDILTPKGTLEPYALPQDLYILAAMNQADASVEPLDVAFLRRWEPFVLEPNAGVLRGALGIAGADVVAGELPATPDSAKQVFEASVRAWEKLNRRISLGRGSEFQVGHGVFMADVSPNMTKDAALAVSSTHWGKVRAHVQEVFFGDLRGVAATFNAIDGPDFNPLRLEEAEFANDLRYELVGPSLIGPDKIYEALRAIGM